MAKYANRELSQLGDRLATAGLSRRQFLGRLGGLGGIAVFGGSFATLLAACGGDENADSGSGTATTSQGGAATTPTTAAGGTPATPAAQEDATPTSPAQPASDIQRGGSLTWAFTQIPTKLDPVWSQARTDSIILANIIEPLVRPNRDATDIEPAVAESWEASDDGLSFTFHLRSGLTFHNGNPVTPDDVIASLERAKTMGVHKWSLEQVKSFEKVDDSTVLITLSTKVAGFLARTAMISNAIFPKEEIETVGEEEFIKPIGTGPFQVTEWVPNDHLTLDKNPSHWETGADGEPLPYLDQVQITEVAEDATKVLQIQAGSLHGTEGIPYSQVAELEKNPAGQLVFFPNQQLFFMVLQLTKPPFDDLKVRQAMSLALDRQVFVDRATGGTAEVANSLMPNSSLCWNPDSTLPYDLEKAKQLIAESTYPDGHKGAKLQVPSGNTVGRDNAVIAQQMWSDIGIDLTIEEVEGSTLGDNWYKSNFEAISGYQWTNGMMDPEQLIRFFFIDPRMNTDYEPAQEAVDLVEAASIELDPDVRCEIYGQLQDIYNEDVGGTISLYYTPSVNYLAPEVKDFYRSPLGIPKYQETWLEQ